LWGGWKISIGKRISKAGTIKQVNNGENNRKRKRMQRFWFDVIANIHVLWYAPGFPHAQQNFVLQLEQVIVWQPSDFSILTLQFGHYLENFLSRYDLNYPEAFLHDFFWCHFS